MLEPETWQKIEEAVSLASEIKPSQRGKWLDDFCGADQLLKSEIESLLAFEPAAENFLEKSFPPSIAALLPDVIEPEISGKQFGSYKIIKEIGRGGMGAVFLAERSDGNFEQQVALKIIRQTFADVNTERYFRRERQILAGLSHPNIAKLLDGGVSDAGELFLVMEFVAGERLLDFAEKQNLSESERLRLFVKICAAVAYAHRSLIVHRDIKPANILVDDAGEPKLLDFGLAKMADETSTDASETQTNFRALTPAYASPEQTRGAAVTTASDVYSLGKVLAELLQAQNTSSKIEKRDAQNSHFLHGDLGIIAAMSLREEPERRYQSAEAFAEDIRLYLSGKPITARRSTFRYRAAKFVKRNKIAAAAAALILLSLVAGVFATVWQARRAEMQRVRAEKRFDEVRQLANSLMFEIHDSVQNLQGSTPTRQLIVSRALGYLDSLAQESADDPNLQIELATAYEKIGDIQGNPYSANLGDTGGAMQSYRKAAGILENLNDSRTTADAQMALGRVYRALGDIMEVKGDVAECVVFYRRSLTVFEKNAANNASDAARDELARAYETLGDGLSRTADGTIERLQNYQKTLEIRQNLVIQKPDDAKSRRALAIAFMKVGGASSAEHDAKAVENLRRAIEIFEDLSRQDPTNARARREVGFAYFQLGNVLTEAGDFAAALDVRRKAFAVRREIADGDRENKQARFDLAAAHADLSEALTNTDDTAEALGEARAALEIMKELSAADAENNVYRRNLALCYEKFANAFSRAAANEKLNVSGRVKNWTEARAWYQKTKEVFADLLARNALQPRDAGQIEKFSAKMTTCDRAIEKLQEGKF